MLAMEIKRRYLWFGIQVLVLLLICNSCIVDSFGSIQYGFGFVSVGLGDRVTHVSFSPDRSKRVFIVYLRRLIPGLHDQNYELRLQKKGEASAETIYESGDLEGTAETERVVWSHDGSKFILLTSNPKYVKYAKFNKQGLALLKSQEAIIFIFDVVENQACSITPKVLEEFNLPNSVDQK